MSVPFPLLSQLLAYSSGALSASTSMSWLFSLLDGEICDGVDLGLIHIVIPGAKHGAIYKGETL